MRWWFVALAACGGSSNHVGVDGSGSGSGTGGGSLADCPLFPSSFVFNTRIDGLHPDPMSGPYVTSIGGTRKLHLDLGTQTDQQQADYYGIPYNVVHGAAITWPAVSYTSTDPGLTWDPKPEADCADASHAMSTPCTTASPVLPIPASPVVEGGINSAADEQPYGDHHLLVVDSDACRLWEAYHVYSPSAGTWNIFGSASWDLKSTQLRAADWTSADAAGLPILPLLLRADEANTGTIAHALRFTISTSRKDYVWPARHQAGSTTDPTVPAMGQLFRLKAGFTIPDSDNTQAKAILQAMKTYGMYVADNGSNWYVQGEPSAAWDDATFSQVQSVTGDNFEAVDITEITSRSGFDPDSGAVP